MPSDTWPYVLRAAMSKSPGNRAPGSATTTRSPAAKLWAPQTMPRGSGSPDVHRAPVDRLAVAVLLGRELEDAADHDRALDVAAHLVDGLDLEPGADERVGQLPTGQVGGQGRVLAQPGDRRPHRAVPTSERLNRTSPSTMSRMSSAAFRNINVRSTPMPKAKPE